MKPPFNRKTLALSIALAAACGCDANHVLGTSNGNPGTAGDSMAASSAGASGATAGASGSADATNAAGSSGVAGSSGTASAAGAAGTTIGPLGTTQSWTGYIENAMFPSGSSALKLTFATDANGNAAGTIVFGQGTPPPPATDPNAYYPPQPQPFSLANLPNYVGEVMEGFAYPISKSTMTPQQLRVHADLTQLWQSWCALQTPASDGRGDCLPNLAGQYFPGPGNTEVCQVMAPTTNQWMTIGCGKFVLCLQEYPGPCACGATTCGAGAGRSGVIALDIALDGDMGEGSISGPGIPGSVDDTLPVSAHLTKDP